MSKDTENTNSQQESEPTKVIILKRGDKGMTREEVEKKFFDKK